MIVCSINNHEFEVPFGSTVANVILLAELEYQEDLDSKPTSRPLCGMGTCYGCRVEIDGILFERSCLLTVEEGMEIKTLAKN